MRAAAGRISLDRFGKATASACPCLRASWRWSTTARSAAVYACVHELCLLACLPLPLPGLACAPRDGRVQVTGSQFQLQTFGACLRVCVCAWWRPSSLSSHARTHARFALVSFGWAAVYQQVPHAVLVNLLFPDPFANAPWVNQSFCKLTGYSECTARDRACIRVRVPSALRGPRELDIALVATQE